MKQCIIFTFRTCVSAVIRGIVFVKMINIVGGDVNSGKWEVLVRAGLE